MGTMTKTEPELPPETTNVLPELIIFDYSKLTTEVPRPEPDLVTMTTEAEPELPTMTTDATTTAATTMMPQWSLQSPLWATSSMGERKIAKRLNKAIIKPYRPPKEDL